MKRSRKSLEIERKFTATKADWEPFVALCNSLAPSRVLEVSGPDTYFTRQDTVLRWRHNKDLDELTIKERLSNRSSFVRDELEIKLTSGIAPKEVLSFVKAAGFEKLFRIRKHCVVFWFQDSAVEQVCVAIYRVEHRGSEDQWFIEIEAKKGENPEASKRAVMAWAKDLGISPDRVIDKTLLEIYSDRRTALKPR